MKPDQILNANPYPALENAEPVFILGSVRSGTSVMVEALIKGAGIRGLREGNIGALLQKLLDEVDRHFNNLSDDYLAAKDVHLVARFDREAFKRHVVNYFAALYAKEMGEGRWVDKSPESYPDGPMIRSCPIFKQIFPKAKFIVCLRRGIENVMSRQKKFPQVVFGVTCRNWAQSVEKWYETRHLLGDSALEVFQRDIAIAPGRTADRLEEFLGLSRDQREGIYKVFTGRRYEQSQAATEHREIGLDETPWDEGHRSTFVRLCTKAMDLMGFTMEGQVHDAEVPLRLFVPSAADAADEVIELVNLERDDLAARDEEIIEIRATGGGPSEVRYLDLTLQGHSRFCTELRASGNLEPVRCLFRVEDKLTRSSLVEESVVLAGSKAENWDIRHPEPVRGSYHVVIGVDPGENRGDVTVTWRAPAFRH